jgi:hypothetical protein
MKREQLVYSSNDPWRWTKAIHTDVEDIMDMMDQHYGQEINGIFTPSRTRMGYHLHKHILEQSYRPAQEYIGVARDKTTNKLLAWNWVQRNKYMPYANEEMAVAEFAHTDLNLSTRQRIRLIGQTFDQWIVWCEQLKIPVLCSTSIREDQGSFMRLHDIYGFQMRGSFAYRRCV